MSLFKKFGISIDTNNRNPLCLIRKKVERSRHIKRFKLSIIATRKSIRVLITENFYVHIVRVI